MFQPFKYFANSIDIFNNWMSRFKFVQLEIYKKIKKFKYVDNRHSKIHILS
jgi:hypothetical protein